MLSILTDHLSAICCSEFCSLWSESQAACSVAGGVFTELSILGSTELMHSAFLMAFSVLIVLNQLDGIPKISSFNDVLHNSKFSSITNDGHGFST